MSDGRVSAVPLAEWDAALNNGSFEEVFATLEAVVARLEEGRLPLAESLTCYELGVRLATRCETMLDEAELRVSRLEEVIERLIDQPRAGEA